MIDQSRPQHPPHALPTFTPVPRHYQRHDGWTPDRQQRFIEALADLGSVRAAAHAVNMTPEGAYLLRRHPEAHEFRAAWEAALALGVQRLEDIAMDRALNGVEVPVYAYGNIIGSRTVYNDALLMFLLRNRAAHRFFADNANGNDVATRSHLARLKREWRAEWEAEKRHEDERAGEEALARIDAKLELMRQRKYGADWTEEQIEQEADFAAEEYWRHKAKREQYVWRGPRVEKHRMLPMPEVECNDET
ncbi:MAG: hypothetical protein KGN34_05125 [Sphingomonadales bacterium]|nr:hypothetical protein [Sphingomonadales bacterium]